MREAMNRQANAAQTERTLSRRKVSRSMSTKSRPARRGGRFLIGFSVIALLGMSWWLPATAASGAASDDAVHARGLQLLLDEPLSIGFLSVDELRNLWTVWEPEQRAVAQAADDAQRRQLTFERYGLIDRPAGAEADPWIPLGYTPVGESRLAPNCLVCHGGKVAGQVVPGLPNSHQDFSGLVGDVAALRALRQGKDPEAARATSTFGIPLNFVKGSTNATMYSILLGSMRDEDLNQKFPPELSQPLVHNSIDAPPWWHFRRKSRIYWDGMAPKSVRTLMQFTMAPGLSGEKIRSWEDEFEVIRDFIDQVEAPAYPFEIDETLAQAGQAPFERVCSECHGTYGAEASYPERTVPLDVLGTDPVRLDAIRPESKAKYNRSWFADYGEHPVLVDVEGYVAPPLDGIWATAPYLHNGSVPTLWHMLHPDERPAVWKRTEDGYDTERVGLEVGIRDSVPAGLSAREQRQYFDTEVVSHSADGHRFPEKLTVEERRAVLEYLKTL